ncbi:sigma factor-like helix-turn-helix DNA-binding protein [Alicyclobacillus macrosporangiidus]|jgi:DNA-directed RNA polymerase specialized sigma subunit|uniref:Sigma-70, region 4 n=1 Tax=Alicyclobacillus macrosporangiidus TaxID=392015 RepID=A0A1I7FUT8_9BACL|nr:sigma factor-like helix-turn-helix DNA-binding protein [Alicyclobacillus macrosporangiidus]SFU39931.1 Sigma-70, region 4 [Alicyclobacillus macrosporangiidus]
MTKKDLRKKAIRAIEAHLRCYKSYLAGIRNLQKQLDWIMPSMTAKYDLVGGSHGSFVITSSTEKYAIDRIESKRALDLHKQIAQYKLIVESIDEALKCLSDVERQFVEYRYFRQWPIRKTAEAMGYSEKNVFVIRNQAMDKLLICLRNIV